MATRQDLNTDSGAKIVFINSDIADELPGISRNLNAECVLFIGTGDSNFSILVIFS
jgi:hypothetical protein